MQKQRFAHIAAAWQPLFQAFVLRVLQATNPLFGRLDSHPVYEGSQLAVTHNSDIAEADFQRIAGYFDIPREAIKTTDISAFIAAGARFVATPASSSCVWREMRHTSSCKRSVAG